MVCNWNSLCYCCISLSLHTHAIPQNGVLQKLKRERLSVLGRLLKKSPRCWWERANSHRPVRASQADTQFQTNLNMSRPLVAPRGPTPDGANLRTPPGPEQQITHYTPSIARHLRIYSHKGIPSSVWGEAGEGAPWDSSACSGRSDLLACAGRGCVQPPSAVTAGHLGLLWAN